jgi:hypothetical protein
MVAEITKKSFSIAIGSSKYSNHCAHLGLKPIFILRGVENVEKMERKQMTGSNFKKAMSRIISKNLKFKPKLGKQ